jgi:hypothetical protein
MVKLSLNTDILIILNSKIIPCFLLFIYSSALYKDGNYITYLRIIYSFNDKADNFSNSIY